MVITHLTVKLHVKWLHQKLLFSWHLLNPSPCLTLRRNDLSVVTSKGNKRIAVFYSTVWHMNEQNVQPWRDRFVCSEPEGGAITPDTSRLGNHFLTVWPRPTACLGDNNPKCVWLDYKPNIVDNCPKATSQTTGEGGRGPALCTQAPQASYSGHVEQSDPSVLMHPCPDCQFVITWHFYFFKSQV